MQFQRSLVQFTFCPQAILKSYNNIMFLRVIYHFLESDIMNYII